MLGNSGRAERSGEIYLPYVGHYRDNAILLEGGGVLAIGRVPGTPFELAEPAIRNSRLRLLNTVFRNIADDNITICTHLVRYPDREEVPPGQFRSDFMAGLDQAYRERVLKDRLFRNDWFISIIVSPRKVLGKAGSKVVNLFKRGQPACGSEADKRALEDVWQILETAMAEYGIRRLGLRDAGEVTFTEIGEALRLIMTGEWAPVPLVSGHLGASLYTDRVICGKRGFEIRAPDRSRVGCIFSFREYPAKTRPGMLNALLSTTHPVVLSQSFSFFTRAQTHGQLSLKASQMTSAGDKAESQIDDLADAEDAIASNAFVMGAHHLSLAIYADDLAQLGERAGRARARLTDAGAVVVQEGIGMEAAYWSQLPGNSGWRTRPGAITSRNFAGFSSLDNYPAGSRDGHWGPALCRFVTNGKTGYSFITHVVDVGMTVIFGPIGSGKTTLLMFVLGLFEQSMAGRPGTVVFFDKDQGGQLLVLASGGIYLVLRRGEPSGLAPLRGLENTPAARDFLREWIAALIESDGKGGISSEEARRLERGIVRQLSYPPHMRSLAGLREFLMHGPAEGAGARLEKWCRGAALGWAFDGEHDEVRLDAGIVGFDMTHLLDYEEVCAPAAAYLLHRVGAIVDGRRFVMSCDEFRAYLLNERFAAVVDKFLLTVRKNNGVLILATQQPEHVLESRYGATLVGQCMTKILYPSPTADHDTFVHGLKCTEGEYQAVREDMAAGRRCFLLKREAGSVICEFDLLSMPEYVAVLSGRRNTVNFAEKLRRELGSDPAAWLPEFMRRYREAKD